MNTRVFAATTLLFGLCLAAAPSFAQDKKDDPLAKLPQPGAEHALLAKLEGTWDSKVKAWFGAGKAEESTGIMVRKMILDGRYLEERYSGTVMGKPFKGLGVFGYDLDQKKYFMTWMDNFGTGLMVNYGTYDAKTRTWTYVGEDDNPQFEGKVKTRDVLRMITDNEMVFEMYRTPVSTGKEFKIMEITYTRK